MNAAKWIFRIAGIYGILVIAPLYFLENRIATDQPPAITHPEFFYGFIGVTLACQFFFLVISTDPVKYRPLMLVSVWEKWSYTVACAFLFSQHRISTAVLTFSLIDGLLGALFIFSWMKTRSAS